MSEKINKLLARKMRKSSTKSTSTKKKWKDIHPDVKKRIMTNPERRLVYFKEFYDSSKDRLIERLVLAKTDQIHQQLINNMRNLVHGQKFKLSVKKQIEFNNRLEDALTSINKATQKNYYLRNFSKSTVSQDSLLLMYFQRQMTISIGDKAKIRAYVDKIRKDERVARSIGGLEKNE